MSDQVGGFARDRQPICHSTQAKIEEVNNASSVSHLPVEAILIECKGKRHPRATAVKAVGADVIS